MLGCHTAHRKRGIYLWPALMFICVSGTSSCPLSSPHSSGWKSTAAVFVSESGETEAVFLNRLAKSCPTWFWGDLRRTSPQDAWRSFLLYCTTPLLTCTGGIFSPHHHGTGHFGHYSCHGGVCVCVALSWEYNNSVGRTCRESDLIGFGSILHFPFNEDTLLLWKNKEIGRLYRTYYPHSNVHVKTSMFTET